MDCHETNPKVTVNEGEEEEVTKEQLVEENVDGRIVEEEKVGEREETVADDEENVAENVKENVAENVEENIAIAGEDNVVEEEEEKEDYDSDADEDDDDESQPLPPEKIFFGPSEYIKTCKIGSRCKLKSTVEYIEDDLDEELEWFRNHSQFKHLFHMPKEANHMLQGMWMLLLRTASTEKEREAWFVVNGVPIRYSLREHALLTGLDCHDYPDNYKALGDFEFVERMFDKDMKVTFKDVEEKLEELKKKTE